MSVIFKGGSSGMPQDFYPPVPNSGTPQPVINTASMTSSENGVYFASEDVQRPSHYSQTADFMPVCCDPAPETSTDVQQQDISGF